MKSGASPEAPEIIQRKSHVLYFEQYFKKLAAKTIVIENNYIDQDYLKDFAGYYVRCFQQYGPTCTRLHFFQKPFTRRYFLNALGNGLIDPKELGYLGFIVIKPLPETIIGRTCLKYEQSDHDFILAIQETTANLFGVSLVVKTLAFQEQDKVVAACATSALWSAFQVTGRLFQHRILSPFEITRLATGRLPTEHRVFPNDEGINTAQMCDAIRSVGLEPYTSEIIKIGLGIEEKMTKNFTKAMIAAYLRLQIPVLLKIRLYNVDKDIPLENHAVAITGYHLGRNEATPDDETGLLLKASRIDRLYVHDDQVGPFAEMVFEMVPVIILGDRYYPTGLSTSLLDQFGVADNIKALPGIILIPLDPEIRIPFKPIHSVVSTFDALLRWYVSETGSEWKGGEELEWDIHLTTINEFKRSILNSELEENIRCNILLKRMPRFLWRASAYHLNKVAMDLVFDPTDIEQGGLLIKAVEYDSDLSAFIRKIAIHAVDQLNKGNKPEEKIAARIFRQFIVTEKSSSNSN